MIRLSIMLLGLLPGTAFGAPTLLPSPTSIEEGTGSFQLGFAPLIIAPRGDKGAWNAAERLAELMGKTGHLRPRIVDQAPGRSLRFERVSGLSDEAYRINATSEGVSITASSDSGLYYGAVTVWQLVNEDRPYEIPAVTIEDRPRYPWRGMMLDSARHYQSPAFIKRFIEWMSVNKLNRFHWHLVDDQGWRIQIRKYPRLTEFGASRQPATAPGAPPLPRVGGFYTQAEIRDIVAFAATRGVTVVPEIELPGHALSAVRAYPDVGLGVAIPAGVESHWGVFPWLYNVDERTIGFLQDVLTEVMALFPSREIHLGGDEAVKDQWRADARIQAKIKLLGLRDESALQGWLMGRMARFLQSHRRRMIGWDEILDAKLPDSAVVMSWRGAEGAEKAARAGHDTILAAAPTLYFDHRESAAPDEPPGRGKVVTLKDVLAFDPMPVGLKPAEQAHVLGLQGQLWTEHMRTEARVAWKAFPRAMAVAEIGWAGKADYEDFTRRLKPQLERMEALGLRASNAAFTPSPVPRSDERRSAELQTCSGKLDLYLEDDHPAGAERARYLIDILEPCWRWHDIPLRGATAIELSVGQLPFNFQVGSDRQKIRFRTPASEAGEFEVRSGDCEGPLVATLPLAPASGNPGVTLLRAPLRAMPDARGLCLTYTASGPDPLWAIERLRLVR